MKNPFEVDFHRYQKKRAVEEGVQDIYSSASETVKEKYTGPIEFSYTYESGEIFELKEQEDGEILATLATEKDVIDLRSYLPNGYKFISQAALNKLFKEEDRNIVFESGFGCSQEDRLIIIDAISDPKNILAVLHEMGHALIDKSEKEIFDYQLKTSGYKNARTHNEAVSIEERAAWANALLLARRLRSDLNINVLEPFESLEDIQKYVYSMLFGYRTGGELIFEKDKIKQWWKSLSGDILNAEDMEYMRKLFDKEKLSRLYGTEKHG